MKTNKLAFRKENIAHIKSRFDQKTGTSLSARPRPAIKRTLFLVTALSLCAVIGVTAVAANVPTRSAFGLGGILLRGVTVLAESVPDVYRYLYKISPETAQFFKPVQLSCEDNGIRMEVVSTYIVDGTAQIYITLQDLTGERLDMSTDLFDSYYINTPFAFIGTTDKNVSYDEETGKLTALITIELMDGHKFAGDKLTFRFKQFLSGKKEHSQIALDVDLAAVSLSPDLMVTKKVRGFGGSEANVDDIFTRDEEGISEFITLKQSPEPTEIVSGVTLTATGYVDGKLHVQLCYDDINRTDNHGFLYLIDDKGESISDIYSVSFWDDEGNTADYTMDHWDKVGRDSYEDYVFDVEPSALANYELYGDFVTCDSLVKGDWEVTFPLMVEGTPRAVAKEGM